MDGYMRQLELWEVLGLEVSIWGQHSDGFRGYQSPQSPTVGLTAQSRICSKGLGEERGPGRGAPGKVSRWGAGEGHSVRPGPEDVGTDTQPAHHPRRHKEVWQMGRQPSHRVTICPTASEAHEDPSAEAEKSDER